MNTMLVRQVAKELRSATTERLRLSPGIDLTRPTSIRGLVNERCNYRCRYCNFWRLPRYQQELTIEQWKHALLSLKDLAGRYNIQFAGGEPFLKPGFIDLLEFCDHQGIGWGVITNGSALTDKNTTRVVAANPLNVDISVDSHLSSENDYLRGVDGACVRVETGVGRLAQQRHEQGKRFAIRLKPVVTTVNFRSLVPMVKWASDIGADTIDFSPVRPWSRESKEELPLTDESDLRELDEIARQLLSLKAAGAPIETSDRKLAAMADHFRGRKTFTGLSPCRVGMRDYIIRSNGDVEVCWFFPAIGNVKQSSAREIWLGERARKIRSETIACKRFGTSECANSCLTHLSLGQQMTRGMLWLRTGHSISKPQTQPSFQSVART